MGIQIRIAEHSAVQMHYHLTTDNGDTVDSSKGRQPLEYLHGHGHLVSGVERALEGKETGDTFTVVVAPEDGYGHRDPQLDVAMPLSIFPEEFRSELAEGVQFRGPHPADPEQAARYVVMKLEESQVLCTANHPLAGETLHFNIEVVGVRAGTAGEIADGQIHRADCSTGCC